MSAEVGGILQALYDARGSLTPEIVVDEARDAAHPLHSRFEWDDSVAGELYRREQARDLIRSVKVVYGHDDQGKNKSVRAFVSDRSNAVSPTYKPVEEVVADPLKRQMLLREMEREWLQFKARYEHLNEFAQLFDAERREKTA